MLVSQSAEDLNGNDAWRRPALTIAKLGTFEWEVNSGVVRLDLRSREIFGFSADEDVTAEAVFGRIHEGELASVHAESMAAVTAGKPIKVDYRIVLPDGGIRHVDSMCEPVFSPEGRTLLMLGVFVDITDQKNADVALRESEERFRTMADRAPVMMWVTDPSGFCTHLNARWYEFTGQRPRAGEGYGWLDAVHPEDRPAAEVAFVSANNEQRDYRIEFRLRAADGVYRWTIDTAAARFDDAGQYLGYVGVVACNDDRLELQ